MTLILIFGFWINTEHITFLKQSKHSCVIRFVARQEHVVIYGVPCRKVAAEINKTLTVGEE